jgi:hypothetical protein
VSSRLSIRASYPNLAVRVPWALFLRLPQLILLVLKNNGTVLELRDVKRQFFYKVSRYIQVFGCKPILEPATRAHLFGNINPIQSRIFLETEVETMNTKPSTN